MYTLPKNQFYDHHEQSSSEDLNPFGLKLYHNIQGMNEAIANDLRQELSRGIMNLESTQQLSQRVKKVMDIGVNRAKMIARTEANRAFNQAHLDAAKQSGLEMRKWLLVTKDGRTSNICLAEDRKYGTEKKSIPLNQEFVVNVNGKQYRAQAPPFHPNCRTRLMTVQV
jgi:SPP1 gp7 family putative phage head morphogenesis protein